MKDWRDEYSDLEDLTPPTKQPRGYDDIDDQLAKDKRNGSEEP